MNEPIISPWIFYLLSVIDNLRCAVSTTIGVILVVLFCYPLWNDYDEDFKWLKRLFTTLGVSGILLVFIPTSDVIIKMTIAQHITANNIEKAGNLTELAVDKIIEKVVKAARELKGDKE